MIPVDDDIPQVDADPQHNVAARLRLGLDRPLNGERTLDRVDYARELHQRAVADEFDHPAFMLGYSRVEYCLTVMFERRQCTGLVGTHHKRVADHVGRQDSRKPAVGLLIFGHAPIRIGDCRATLALSSTAAAASTWQLGSNPVFQ